MPELFRPLKAAVDRDRRPGRFLLTGSAQVLLLPRLSESLAGRMEILTLWPLARARGRRGTPGRSSTRRSPAARWRPVAAASDRRRGRARGSSSLGGFPEVRTLRDARRADAWFASYVTTILQRDVRDIANVDGLVTMPTLLALLAARSAGLLNVSELSRSAGIKLTTLNRYLALLETVFLVQRLPAWSAEPRQAPRQGAQAALRRHRARGAPDRARRARARRRAARRSARCSRRSSSTSCRRQLGWAETRARLFHFRSADRREVDVVIEDAAGRIVGVEVRASATPGAGRLQRAARSPGRSPAIASCAASCCISATPRCRSATGSRPPRCPASGWRSGASGREAGPHSPPP